MLRSNHSNSFFNSLLGPATPTPDRHCGLAGVVRWCSAMNVYITQAMAGDSTG